MLKTRQMNVLLVKLFLVIGLGINYPAPAPVPEDLYQIPDGRDLGPESASHFCTFAQAVGRFALLHL